MTEKKVEVIQSDREAFARSEGWKPGDGGWKMIVDDLRCDNTVGVQAFARHRLTHSSEEGRLREALEEDDLDTPEARLAMVRVAVWHIAQGGSAVALAKAALDFIDLTAAERAKMRGDAA